MAVRDVAGRETVSTAEAAELIGVSRRQILRYLDDGYLNGFRAPGRRSRVRVYVASIREFRAEYEINPEDGEKRRRES